MKHPQDAELAARFATAQGSTVVHLVNDWDPERGACGARITGRPAHGARLATELVCARCRRALASAQRRAS